jgi:hypothetical protein
VALSGDAIQKCAFWQRFKETFQLRTDAVHKGKQVLREDADLACDVAKRLVEHLSDVLKATAPP